MMRTIVCLCFIVIGTTTLVRADEKTRQAQEELRKRNLYFGNVDGQESSELSGALKRYQTRKGFAVTGTVDDETATSLHILTAAVSAGGLPDLPVLRSDAARELPPPQRIALERAAEENADSAPSPFPPAEPPGPGQDLTPERVTKLVSDYLRDAETDNVAAQVNCFAYPVEYFDHGSVDEQFVLKDVRNYLNRWPQRKYTLSQPVSFFAGGREGETTVEFLIAYDVRNKKHAASGRTKNWWTLRAEGDELKIVAIREQRLRE
jgi:peptidoglycan hydrolase-like protein with peptidoglycan-binding domain